MGTVDVWAIQIRLTWKVDWMHTLSFVACYCSYKGHIYHYGATIYDTHDGDGHCITAVCGENGNITRIMEPCVTTPTTTQIPTTSTIFIFTSGKKNNLLT